MQKITGSGDEQNTENPAGEISLLHGCFSYQNTSYYTDILTG
jgi:hypothetical protein